MIDVAVRLISAWLGHDVYGVNALAAAIPRARFGTADVDDAPPAVVIENDADDEGIARAFEPTATPAFIVFGDSDADTKFPGYRIAKEVIIGAAYVTDDQADDFTANRACGYLMRAGKLSLARYNSQQLAGVYRTLNGVSIMKVSEVREQRVTAASGRFKLHGFLFIHCIAVDTFGGA